MLQKLWKCCRRICIRMRLIRLSFLRVKVPDDAMTQEEMLAEIKRKTELRKLHLT